MFYHTFIYFKKLQYNKCEKQISKAIQNNSIERDKEPSPKGILIIINR